MIFRCWFITNWITVRWHSGWNITLGCMYLMVGMSSYIYCRCHQINQGDRGWWKVSGLFTVCWPDLLSVIYFVDHQKHLWVGFSTMLRTRSHKSTRASCLYLFLSLFPLSLSSPPCSCKDLPSIPKNSSANFSPSCCVWIGCCVSSMKQISKVVLLGGNTS